MKKNQQHMTGKGRHFTHPLQLEHIHRHLLQLHGRKLLGHDGRRWVRGVGSEMDMEK